MNSVLILANDTPIKLECLRTFSGGIDFRFLGLRRQDAKPDRLQRIGVASMRGMATVRALSWSFTSKVWPQKVLEQAEGLKGFVHEYFFCILTRSKVSNCEGAA